LCIALGDVFAFELVLIHIVLKEERKSSDDGKEKKLRGIFTRKKIS
jgi:hypothetical protein